MDWSVSGGDGDGDGGGVWMSGRCEFLRGDHDGVWT